jgi:hypothetical protein
MWFDSLDGVKAVHGHVPPQAQAVLADFVTVAGY